LFFKRDITTSIMVNNNNNNEREVKMFGKDNRALSKVSSYYDVGAKGFLTDTEKQMRGMDSDNLGHLTNAQVSSVVTETLALREKNDQMKKWIGILGVFVIILALSNLGTAFAAAWLAKDTTVNETGQLLMKDSDTPVTVRANGQTSTLVLEQSSSYGCMDREEAATLWAGVLDGTTSALTIQESSSQQDDDPTVASFVAKTLITNGATWNETMACMPISNDNGSGEKVCIDFTDSRCDAHHTGSSRALEVIDHHTRRKLFHAAGQGHRGLGHADGEHVDVGLASISVWGAGVIGTELDHGAYTNGNSSEGGMVYLGTAASYTILAKTGISTVPTSVITGDIAVSPGFSTAITGFSLFADHTPVTYSASVQIVGGGKAYGADYGDTRETLLTAAVESMMTAYDDAKKRNTDPVSGTTTTIAPRLNYGGGTLGSATAYGSEAIPLTPGVYTFTTDVYISTNLHFLGDANDIFIIQIEGNLVQAANKDVILDGGAKAENIFWQVAGTAGVSVGAGATMQGILLVKTAATFITGSTLNGRVFAQTACVLQSTTVTPP
jgi:hypothetical protein